MNLGVRIECSRSFVAAVDVDSDLSLSPSVALLIRRWTSPTSSWVVNVVVTGEGDGEVKRRKKIPLQQST
jgi:hypothetical protein